MLISPISLLLLLELSLPLDTFLRLLEKTNKQKTLLNYQKP